MISTWIGGSVGAGVVGVGVEGTVKRDEQDKWQICEGKPVGGIVVGVVSGLGAALLGVTEHRVRENYYVIQLTVAGRRQELDVIQCDVSLTSPSKVPWKMEGEGITY